jgi:hypothetical protein
MPHSIFAMEVCIRLPPQSTLPAELRMLVLMAPKASSYDDKFRLYRRAADLVLANLDNVAKGCWDYFDDDAKALSDYKMWVDGMLTEEGARTSPSRQGGGDPYRAESAGYLTLTMAFLLVKGTSTDLQMAARCNIPPAQLWQRWVFERMLQGVPLLNFASVKSDVIYVIPGDDRWALTAQDLAEPKFNYLRPIG